MPEPCRLSVGIGGRFLRRGGRRPFSFMSRATYTLLPLAGDADAPGPQLGMDARSPRALAAILENAADSVNEVGFGAVLCRSGLIAGLPVMEPATRHSQNRAQQPD